MLRIIDGLSLRVPHDADMIPLQVYIPKQRKTSEPLGITSQTKEVGMTGTEHFMMAKTKKAKGDMCGSGSYDLTALRGQEKEG